MDTTSSQSSADIARKSAFVPLDDFFRPRVRLMGLRNVEIVDAADLERDMFIILVWVDSFLFVSVRTGILTQIF